MPALCDDCGKHCEFCDACKTCSKKLIAALTEISEMTLHRHTLDHAVKKAREVIDEHNG